MSPTVAVPLDDRRTEDAALAGAKAANLARCTGLPAPVVPGFVLTTEGTRRWPSADVLDVAQEHWAALGGDDHLLVVRSSSTIEDAGSSSMAGQFTSVLDVKGWDAFLDAVQDVIRSADRFGDSSGRARPIAVLVQRQLDAAFGGVLFGLDPVTGDRSRITVEVVPSRPDTLVGGTATATHLALDGRGRVRERSGGTDAPDLPRRLRRRLVRLAAEAEQRFGGPQDIEWAVDGDDRLWLLQCRPVTATGQLPAGPVLGPGPVAETFPAPLTPLEQDLFLPPLRQGIVDALDVVGAVSRRRLSSSPVLVAVDGRVAVDLELLGIAGGREGFWKRMAPRSLGRHLLRAWRVGRTRVAMAPLAAQLVRAVDEDLEAVPPLGGLTREDLVDLMDRAGRELATVHRYEVLAGMLLQREDQGPPAAALALAALRPERRADLSDDALVATNPVLLALTAPSFAAPGPLPSAAGHGDPAATARDAPGPQVDDLRPREALRLRARWLQELLVRAGRELGRRLAASSAIPTAGDLALLRWPEVRDLAAGGPAPPDLGSRPVTPRGAPLPAAFRLAGDGTAVPVRPRRRSTGDGPAGLPAGGGRATGPACHRATPGTAPAGCVLVVRHLEPGLAPLLPGISGLVAESGSALSHLAILAREMGVATVVGVPDARTRFPAGRVLVVDGTTGDVEMLHEEEVAT